MIRRPRRVRAWSGAAAALGALTVLAGCATIMEPRREYIVITNETDATITVRFGVESDAPVRSSPAPGDEAEIDFSGDETGCVDRSLSAWTEDGVLVATYGPPVCADDEWAITQAELDAVRTASPTS